MGGDGVFSIVAGVDGSAPSRLALEWAVTEARLRNGQVRAATASEFPPVTVGMENLVWDPEVFPQTARQLRWHTVVGAVGLIMGLLPHVLHHIGLLAGTALVAGSGGTALFGALGLLASIPILVRLCRRFGSWIAPAPDTHPGPHMRAHRRPLNTQEIPDIREPWP